MENSKYAVGNKITIQGEEYKILEKSKLDPCLGCAFMFYCAQGSGNLPREVLEGCFNNGIIYKTLEEPMPINRQIDLLKAHIISLEQNLKDKREELQKLISLQNEHRDNV